MNDLKLYEITEQYQEVLRLVESEEGYSFEDLKDTLDSIADMGEEKMVNTGHALRKLQDELTIIKNRKTQIAELEAKKKRDIDNLKSYLLFNMEMLGKKKVETPTIKVATRNNKVVNIIDESKLPEEFVKTEVKTTPKKADFKKYYEALSDEEKEQIDYAEVVINKSINIK